MRFAKWHGAGNDFLLFFPEDGPELERRLPGLAPRLCNRRMGLGADGVLLLIPQAVAELRLLYFNSDGSRASFCANGSRCAAAYAARRLGLKSLLLVTDFAPIPAIVRGLEVTLELPPVDKVGGWKTLPAEGQVWKGFFLTLGVPHLLVPVAWEDFWRQPLTPAPTLRRHPLLGPEGANVNFLKVANQQLLLRTFERGVEGETLACGSGAAAAAQLALAEGWLTPPVAVRTTSGRVLQVQPLGTTWGPCQLTGPAEPVAFGEVAPELERTPEELLR